MRFLITQPYEIIDFSSGDFFVDSIRISVGAKIKALRKAANMSQADLGYLIGCEAPLVGRYERGLHLPGIEQLIRIAEVLDVAPGELLPGGQDVKKTRLIAVRQKIALEVNEIASIEFLEGVLALIEKFTAENPPSKK
jgi:transcriptional regulator with XRE-family HTH domain